MKLVDKDTLFQLLTLDNELSEMINEDVDGPDVYHYIDWWTKPRRRDQFYALTSEDQDLLESMLAVYAYDNLDIKL